MKRISKMLAILLFAALVPVAFAQHAGHGGTSSGGGFGHAANDSAMGDFQRALRLQATDDQRVAFANCMKATKKVHKLADQMVGPGTRWRYDADVFPNQEKQLQAALAELDAVHQQFRHSLSQDQEWELRKYISKLDQLNTDLGERIARVDRELSRNKPDWRLLYSDTHKIKEQTEKWRSEHQKIAKEMGIGG